MYSNPQILYYGFKTCNSNVLILGLQEETQLNLSRVLYVCLSVSLIVCMSSVESQKGIIPIQQCSVENQKDAITVQSLWW